MLIFDVSRLAQLYRTPLKRIAEKLIFFRGCELPRDVKIGNNVHFPHNAVGTVVHRKTVIEEDAFIFPNVTIGKADIFEDWKNSKVKGFHIGKGSTLCAGARVLCKEGMLEIGDHAIVAANAVLTHSIGPYEVWGGTC